LEPNQEYQTVILAAFLHDIGKLLGRGSFKILDKGQHPKFSADFISAYHEFFSKFCDADLIKELVQKHHENERAFSDEFLVQSINNDHRRTLARLVSQADNLSSAERGESADKYQDYKTTPLCSVLERLDKQSDVEPRLRFHASPLTSTTATDMRTRLFYCIRWSKLNSITCDF
jgi:CRISPR-associated protein Csm1